MEVMAGQEIRRLYLAGDNHDQRDQGCDDKGKAQKGREKIVHGQATPSPFQTESAQSRNWFRPVKAVPKCRHRNSYKLEAVLDG
jgi:hypothetical protein